MEILYFDITDSMSRSCFQTIFMRGDHMKRFSVVIGFVFASSLLLAGCRKQDAVFNTEKTGALEQQTEMAEKSS